MSVHSRGAGLSAVIAAVGNGRSEMASMPTRPALPECAFFPTDRVFPHNETAEMVGAEGFEPPTLWSQTSHSLRHKAMIVLGLRGCLVWGIRMSILRASGCSISDGPSDSPQFHGAV